ncbi:uncharacterized protein MONOS_3820 [Monocercomonoides exilis]|uniref:uncharacterized protein n=1 Tax=Monocercomonoides exilis TaxID=2049356 RepID=UPI00355ABD97|nr:hypothetical protein MONOS_3820 [Monocercomonoides exilis]|eukprot:MONOS_3820.1-p1 / transcript=MONOS_3820.1 / gene=MONOS_3820 / organism=Monocercomonoides_exilis_PA203 / gene_product=unspecified product / transcript_product=unspecified product / location=Mono_scaffold00094:21100-21972(+) / protein_length=291 / sequence_SO=supercontig / SO=protein_coding / is_pseudo=false
MEKGLSEVGLRMEDMVLSPAAIALVVLEEREEAEEGERGCKEGEEKGTEKGEEDGGREGGDGNEEKGGYPTAHRESVERIKENQGKLEEAMTLLVVEALGLSRLRFVKAGPEAETEAGADKQHSEEPEVCSSFPSDGMKQDNWRAAEEAADGSLEITSDGSAEGVGKDVKQVEMSKNGLGMNEEQGKEDSSIDLEKEEEEEEEEWQILDVESLLSVPAHPECVTLVDESANGSWRDYLVTMTVTVALVELCAEWERIVGKPVVEGMIQSDGLMSITYVEERQIQRERESE